MRSEPVLTGVVVRLIMAAAARYGLELSAEDVLYLWGALELILGLVTRSRVTPVRG